MPLLVQLVRAHGYQRQIVSEADALTALRKLHPQDSVIGDVPKKRSDDGSLRNTHIHPSPAPAVSCSFYRPQRVLVSQGSSSSPPVDTACGTRLLASSARRSR
ncbi:uncharacterized protein LOC143350740 isoform X1 [Colletes latitarsis]|uniref:uncharacterized protein LOC143341216 isoform X1 n=1 Tax=Colletes latitarsis TaxID=2605962 RepID=UPI004035557A